MWSTTAAWAFLRHPAPLILLLLLTVFSITSGATVHAATFAPPSPPAEAIAPPFTLPSAESLLNLLASPSSTAASLASQPVLVLFTDGSVADDSVASLQATVQQLAADVPAAVARVHTYAVPPSVTERRLVDLLLNGVAARLPALVLFHTSPQKAQTVPGMFLSPVPFFVPVPFPRVDRPAALTYAELRTWLLSEMPARYIDPLSYHLLPSLQFVFHPADVQETLRVVRRTVVQQEGRSVLPDTVVLAYTQLTTSGAEDVVAALSSLAAQAGNAVLVLVTESADVAAQWGLKEEHTMSTAAWSVVEAAYTEHHKNAMSSSDTSSTRKGTATVTVVDATPSQSIRTVSELVKAASAWSSATQRTLDVVSGQLRTWSRALEAFNTTSPLRKLDTAAHVVHELTTLQQSIKVVFVLRESDELWFHHHLDVAASLAGRLLQTSVLFNATTLYRQSKVPSRVVRLWTPTLRVEVFWIDAEQLPDVADLFSVSQVPSVLVLAPLQSRYEESGEKTDGEAEEAGASAAGLRSRDPLIGVHVVNRYDLNTVALINDATAAVDPPTGKDALPVFPADSDALVRFLASQSFLNALQFAIQPVRLSKLRAAVVEREGVAATTPAASPSTLPNRRYAQLDYRYYPMRPDEVPREGPVYVRQILNGSAPLPLRTAEDSTGGATRTTTAAEEERAAVARRKAERAAAAKKAAWEAELAARKREKAARIEKKAAEDAAAREKERVEFQRSVDAAFQEEGTKEGEAHEQASGAGNKGRPSVPGAAESHGGARRGVLVRRPPREAGAETTASPPSPESLVDGESEDAEDVLRRLRRRRLHAEYKEWQADRARMVEGCVSLKNGRELSLRFKWD